MVAPPPSLTSPRRWRKWVEEKREKKLLCHFIHEGKPSPVIFTSISLTISSYKRTEIKFVAFMASMMEVGMRWEKWKLGDANQVLVDLKIFLSHIIISAYFLKSCKHILSWFIFADVDFYLQDSWSNLMSKFPTLYEQYYPLLSCSLFYQSEVGKDWKYF